MDTPTTTSTEDVAEKATTEESQDTSSSSQEQPDYDALIDAEKKRGPDPDKAKEAFKKREEKREDKPEPKDEDLDKPLTRREMEEYLSRRSHEIVTESQSERIQEIAIEMAESEGEARLIMEVHKNRVFPQGLSLRDQLKEASYIANGQRLASKNVELARKIQSKETASKDTASTHHEATGGTEPKLASDVAASLRRAGFSYDNSKKLYSKKLANGKTLFRDPKSRQNWIG